MNRIEAWKQQHYKGHFDLALLEISKLSEEYPNNSHAYLFRGVTYQAQNKYSLALQDYSKAIELNPKSAEAYNNRGITYKDQNKFDLAIQDFSKAIELNPNFAKTYYNRGTAYLAQNKYDLAIQDCSKAIELDPDYSDAYNNRGNIYNFQHKFDLALQDYSKAIELNPNNAKAYYNSGSTYQDYNKFALALQFYTKAIELNPNYANAYYNRGITYQAWNKYDLALQDYIKSIELVPDQPLFLANLGALLISQKQNQEAQKYLQKAQNILNSCDEETLMSKFSLCLGNLQFVKNKIKLLQQIDEKLQQLSNQAQELKKQKTLTPQQEKLIQQTQSEVATGLQFVSKNNQQDEINNLKHIIEILSEELTNFKMNQNQVNQDLKQGQQILEKYDHNFIAKTLQDYKQPQNRHKLIYYRSFCSRLLTYIQACMLIQTDLFNVNIDSALETNTEKLVNKINNGVQKASSLLAGIPVVGSVLEVSLGIIDYGINCYKQKQFQDKVKNITAVIQQKSGVSSDIEREVQMASFQIIDKIQQYDLLFSNFQFQEIVSKVLQNEKSEFVNNPYWKLGIDHSLRALKFIEQYSSKNLTANMELKDIIFNSIDNQELKGQSEFQVQVVEDKDCCKCCEIF